MNAEARSQIHQTLLSRRHAIADNWYKAIARTGSASLSTAEVRQHLVELTEQAIALLFTEPFEHSQAEAIGASLGRLHYVEPEALGRTQKVLVHQLTEGLSADQVVALQPRLASLLSGLAAGFFQQARETILAEQEQIRSAFATALRLVNEQLKQEIEERKRAQEGLQETAARLARRLEMEHVLSSISARFVHTRDLDQAINLSLEQMGQLVGVDRCYLFRFSDDGRTMDNTHEWCSEGTTPQIQNLQGLDVDMVPWWMERLRRDENIVVSDVAQLPPEAGPEEEILERQGIRSLLVVPLHVAGQLYGTLGFDDVKGTQVWLDEDVRLLRTAGEIIARGLERAWAEEALRKAHDELEIRVRERTAELATANEQLRQEITERKRAEEEIKQRNRELSALNAIAATVNQPLDLEEVLTEALDKVLETMELEAGAIRLLSENRSTLDLKVHRGVDLPPQIVEWISRVKLAESSLAEVVANGEPLVIEDISANLIVELIGGKDLKSLAVIPLRSKGQVLGTMEVVSLHPRQFTHEEIQLLTSIGNQIGVAIQNAQLWCEMKRRLQESAILLEVSQGLASVLELEELLQLILDSALEIIKCAESGVIHLLDDATGKLYPKAMAGKPSGAIGKERMCIGKGIAGGALKQGKVINVPDVDADPRFITLGGTHQFKSLLVAPLVTDGKTVGTISLNSGEIGAFTPEDARLMLALAAHAATAVKNAQLFARSEELAAVKERNRIACEIHDGLAQNLASLSMKIDFCLGLLDSDPQATKAVLSEAKAFVQENIREIRRSIFALHPPDLKELGFLAALRKYAQEFQEQNALPVHLSIAGEEVQSQLPLRYEYELFRIVQEALNNVRRHARAKNVWISIDLSVLDVVSLTVMDDGLGFDGEEQEMAGPALVGGFGLESMKERAKALGGKLLVETEPGSGTKVTAILPLGLSLGTKPLGRGG